MFLRYFWYLFCFCNNVWNACRLPILSLGCICRKAKGKEWLGPERLGRELPAGGSANTHTEAMTGLILLCGVRACHSNLCEMESAPWTPTWVILLKVMGKRNVSCPYPPSDSSQDTVNLLESRTLYKGADRSRTAVDLNKSGLHT